MHVNPEKVAINKDDKPVMPKAFMTKDINNEHHHEMDTHKAAKPKVDIQHHPSGHRPRQLSGRHH